MDESDRLLVWIGWKDIQHPEAGGAELVLHEISRRLVRDGWEVIHLVPGFEGSAAEEIIDGIRIVRIGRSIFSFYRLPFYFRRHLRHRTTMLVDSFISLGSLSCLLMKPERAALIVYHIEHVKWLFQNSSYGIPLWLMPLFNVAGFVLEKLQLIILGRFFRGPVVTISNSTALELRRLGFAKKRLKIMSVGIGGKPLDGLSSSLPKELNFTVLMIGPRKAKRPLHTIAAFELFQKRHPEATLWIAGWGGESDALKEYVERHGLSNVMFLGRVSDRERNELLQRAHVLCTSSIREGWGLVVVEANAMGTPVIGYDVPGLRDSLAFSNGWLCEPSPCSMAERLEFVFSLWKQQGGQYDEVRLECLNASKKFTFDRSYEQFQKIIAVGSKTSTDMAGC